MPRGILGRCLSLALMITSRATPGCEPSRPLTHFANSARPQEWPLPPCPRFRHRGEVQPWCLTRRRNPAPPEARTREEAQWRRPCWTLCWQVRSRRGPWGGGQGSAARRQPAQAALCDPGRCWEDPGNSASRGALTSPRGKRPRVGRPVSGCVNVRHLLDPSPRLLTLGVDVRGWAVLVLRAVLCTLGVWQQIWTAGVQWYPALCCHNPSMCPDIPNVP